MSQRAVLTGITLLAFSVVHSVTASVFFKQWIKSFLGDQRFEIWYRFLYTLLSIISLIPVMFALMVPTPSLWRISGTMAVAFYAVQATGIIGIAVTFLQIDALSFVGIRQLFIIYQSKPQKSDRLVVTGLYGCVRHPLYFFSLLFIWFVPSMSESWFVFSLLATLYFYIGSYFEERKMISQYGNAYLEYKKSVPRIIPFLKPMRLRKK